jgi:hypothetical protein
MRQFVCIDKSRSTSRPTWRWTYFPERNGGSARRGRSINVELATRRSLDERTETRPRRRSGLSITVSACDPCPGPHRRGLRACDTTSRELSVGQTTGERFVVAAPPRAPYRMFRQKHSLLISGGNGEFFAHAVIYVDIN